MPTFTVDLKRAIELTEGDIGLDDYPIFDEEHRKVLNQKIIDRYYRREIGAETVDLFRHFLRRKMHEVMPYYNQLYESEKIKFDPLNTVDMESVTDMGATNISETESVAQNTTSSDTESKSRAVASELPQVQLSGDEDYATAATDNVSGTNTSGDSDSMATDSSVGTAESQTVSRQKGYSGSASELLNRYRETFMNIDLMIVDELEDLFMGIWNTSDFYQMGY